ncbi:hypothetical protein D3C73_1494890 [compost metagenome]
MPVRVIDWLGSTAMWLPLPRIRSAAFCAVPAVNASPAPLRRVTLPVAGCSCCRGGSHSDSAPSGSSPLANARAAAMSTCSSGIATSRRAPSTTVMPSRLATL